MTKRPDNATALRAAARRRSELARQRTLEAISALVSENETVTATAVARRAGVSRQWLYTFEEARKAIGAAQRTQHGGTAPQQQRASVASLLRRIDLLTDDNQRLRRRVEHLEHRLAGAYGALRSSRT